MPLTQAEKSKRYREKLKKNNPEKYREMLEMSKVRASQRYRKMTEERNEDLRNQWRNDRKKYNASNLTPAEKSKRYREKLKKNNPEKYREMLEISKFRANRRYRKMMSELTEEQKEDLRKQWRKQNDRKKYSMVSPGTCDKYPDRKINTEKEGSELSRVIKDCSIDSSETIIIIKTETSEEIEDYINPSDDLITTSTNESREERQSTSALDPLSDRASSSDPRHLFVTDSLKEENYAVDMSVEKPELRAVTYMCPTHSVQYYELILGLLEEALGCYTTLQYESRMPGPVPERPDPFENGKIDIAFMTAAAYKRLRARGNPWVELLPVTPVFAHQMNVDNRSGYFCDVIMHVDKRAHNVNTLLDLRGCTFAYSNEESLSGCKLVLKTLQEKGENASFFRSQIKSGSHWSSAQMVLTKQADWAAVDSTTLLYSKKFMQDGGKDITILETLGRLPAYPIVVNSRLSEEKKKAITDALLKLPQDKQWKKQFAKFGVIKFESNSDGAYDGPAAQMSASSGPILNVRYY